MTEYNDRSWQKVSRDDYNLRYSQVAIVRLPAENNAYINTDEWTVYHRSSGVAYDTFTRLRDAKAYGEEVALR